MNYTEITKIYREIGRKFHDMGADQVVLLKSGSCQAQEIQMYLEIAVDGMIDQKELMKQAKLNWPQVEIRILDLNEDPNLIQEVVEDGIVL